MPLSLLFLLLFAIGVYWFVTQIMPERRRVSLVRAGLGDGLIATLNERRHRRGMSLLELDDTLCAVAENKAVHQVMTGLDDQGWDYPANYADLLGRSLFMEMLLCGPFDAMAERLIRQRDAYDGEWVRCGIGVAGGKSGQVAVAVILSREAWEPAVATTRTRKKSLADWFALGK
jgi:hypothetical protein